MRLLDSLNALFPKGGGGKDLSGTGVLRDPLFWGFNEKEDRKQTR